MNLDFALGIELLLIALTLVYIVSLLVDLFSMNKEIDLIKIAKVEKRSLLNQQVARKVVTH